MKRRAFMGMVAGSVAMRLTNAGAQQLEEVKIGLPSTSLGGAFIRIAEPIGLFARHGMKPVFTVLESGSVATSALISRSVPAIIGGTSELLFAKIKSQDLVIVANTFSGFGATLVLSRAAVAKAGVDASAPPPTRLKALDNLLIASPSATSDYTFSFKGAAAAQGATIRFTHMAQTAMPAALDTGAIDGYIASAPNWVPPLLRNTGVVWISGPKGELPAELTPISSSNLQMRRDVAQSNPGLARRLANVVADLVKAVDEQPAAVRSAINAYYADLSPQALDIIYASEAASWKARPMSVADIEHDIRFLKMTGANLQGIESIDLKTALWP